jgi:tRNA-2-methylthio-N6-dimethylallyladenosine synthase
VVPYTRGAEFSRPAAQILNEIKALVGAGAVEIQLLGQNVNAYHGTGLDGTEWSLARLIYAVAEINGVKRIRYTTSHPRDMRDDLVQAHRDVPQLMPFLHLPVQSGSNGILQAMNRKHTTDDFLRYIDAMRQARPDIAFSSDFIVGFPGETDADFAETLALIERVGFASAYTFGYSPRPGTPAAILQNQIHPAIISHRLKEIQAAIGHQQLTYNQSFIGQTIDVLLERAGNPAKSRTHNKTPQLQGRSPYMQSTFVEAPDSLIGTIVPVTITGAFPMALNGIMNGHLAL